MQKYKKYLSNKSLFFFYGLISLLFKTSVIFSPIFTGKVIDSAVSKDINALKINGICMILSVCAFLALMYIRSYVYIKINGDIQYGLKKDLFERIIYSDYQSIKRFDLGYYLQRHNSDIEDMAFMFFEYFIDTLINLIYTIILFVSMFLISTKISLVMLVIVPFFILSNIKLIPKIEAKASAYMESEEELNNEFETSFNNNHAIRSLRNENNVFKDYINKNHHGYKMMLNYTLSDERYNTFIISGLLNLCIILVYIFGAYLALKGEISIGQLTTLNIFASRIWDPIEYFLGLKKKISKAKISEKRVLDVINIEVYHPDNLNNDNFNDISIENINFAYDDKKIFDKYRLDLKSNNIYLIKGKNGSGKTTLFNILSGIYFNNDSFIIVDGERIEDKFDFLYRNIYYVPSELYKLKGTIKDNLSNYDYCPIENHSLEDDVKSLSSGETKKLQLLLSLDRKEKIIIYDEPLNYLDKDKYQDFYKIIEKSRDNGHIILIASHEKIKDVAYTEVNI